MALKISSFRRTARIAWRNDSLFGVFVGPQRRFMHEAANGEFRHHQAEEFLPAQPRHGIQVNDHFICSISRRNWVFQLADLRRVPFGFVGAQEAEREAADDGHVLGAVAGAVARQVVLELHVEHPVHALDAPMAARSGGEAFDVERRGRNVDSGVERASVGVFGSIEYVKYCMKARLTRIGFLALDPVDDFRGGKDAGLDAAVAFLDRGFADEFLRRRGFEVGFDLGFQGRLIAFNGSRKSALCSTILAAIST
jgi:hypothetical protein